MASLPPDPWKALGVDKSADKSEIRTAYKKLVLKCHPDKVQDPTLKAQKQDEFQKVQQAYELLNDDAERAKYEEQVKLAELRKQAAMLAKNMPNSSASRSSPRHYEIRTKTSSSTPSGSAKVYQYASVHARSHEEMPSRYHYEDGEKHARRTASYEKPSRDEERRSDDRRKKDDRRRREEDDEYRIRERERTQKEIRERERDVREKERELKERAERAERKKSEKDRDRDRRRGMDDKHRRFPSPYIEDDSAEEHHHKSSGSKRSPSNKPYEGGREGGRDRERQREKSTTSRRPPSPHVDTVLPVPPAPPAPSDQPEYYSNLDKAASYIEKSKRASASSFSQPRGEYFAPPVAPTPPPADADDDHRAAVRAAGRRQSHEASKSREKISPLKNAPYIIESSSPKSSRTMPPLHKSHTVPIESSSPPRAGIHRSSTSQEYSTSIPKVPAGLARQQTWAYPHDRHNDFALDDDSEDDHPRRSRRSNRPSRSSESPAIQTTYKVDGTKATRVDAPGYGYGESPTSSRRYAADPYGPHGSSPHYHEYSEPPYHLKVKEGKVYGPNDVKYSDARYNVSYSYDHYNQVHA